jgi:hypothetical protein
MDKKSLSFFEIKSMMDMGGAEYARSEAWDISQAAQVIGLLANMAMNEVEEPDDVQSLGNVILSIMEFINGEIKEMVAASRAGKSKEVSYATVKEDPKETKAIDLSYIKSLGIEIPEGKLAVKYVGKNVIAHPVFVWGSAEKTDLELEYFTRESDFWDDTLKNVERPLTWDHGQDENFAKIEESPVIGKTVKFYDDDVARWAESVINTDRKYRKFIDQFIEEKRLGYSSDSAPQYVKREKRGKATWLKMWPWFGGALTASPCEPRMKVYTPEFLKSLGITLPDMVQEGMESWEDNLALLDYLKIKYR